jgi:hypothetical protein
MKWKKNVFYFLLKLAFRHAQNHAKDIRNKIKQILQLTHDKSSIVLEETIEKYLRTTIQKYDVGKIILVNKLFENVQVVCKRILF